ncbi:hypothetical protein EV586_102731 [Tumebacillus sp. BK434]|nr:FDLD family class I lanthipeptide [Tumebacillus sp. BK434]TCP58277.1 hypothetical protein EV586_102731 [Tumebacillus sp. BK434]
MEKFFDLDVQVNSVAPSAGVSPEDWSSECFKSIFIKECVAEEAY